MTLPLHGNSKTDGLNDAPRVGEAIAHKYRIEGVLGQGGMSQVFAAVNLKTGKRVALKWLAPDQAQNRDMLARFKREALASGSIDHPNVIHVYDVLEQEGSAFLVMEMLRGEALSTFIERHGRLPVPDSIGIVIEAMRGLAAAHAQGVIHRDLKPANIFLCDGEHGARGGVKVLDFGVSKLAGHIAENEKLSVTRTGTVVGTPYYMAPEQVRGAKEIDERVDVYAMAVVLYEMLAGKPPFDADSYPALMVEIATGTVKPLPRIRSDVPEELQQVVDRAMSRDPDERFRDVVSFAEALEPFGDGTRFRSERPDWTGRIGLPRDGRDVKAVAEDAPTRELDTSGERPVTGQEPPVTGRERTVAAEAAKAPRRPRALIAIGIIGAIGGAIAVAVALSAGSDESLAADEPAQTTESVETASTGSDEPPAGDQQPASDEQPAENATEEEPAAAADEEAQTQDAPAAAEPDERRTQRQRAQARERRARAQRRRRERREASRQTSDTASEPEPSRETKASRAGELSLEDF